jgi:hypothetical protein
MVNHREEQIVRLHSRSQVGEPWLLSQPDGDVAGNAKQIAAHHLLDARLGGGCRVRKRKLKNVVFTVAAKARAQVGEPACNEHAPRAASKVVLS